MKTGLIALFILVISFLPGINSITLSQEDLTDSLNHYNYILGTQTIGPKYRFTTRSLLYESAYEIRSMGSNIVKIHTQPGSYGLSHSGDLVSLFENEPSFHYVINENFTYYFMWVRSNANWKDGYSDAERNDDYTAIYNFTRYLLLNYNGTGKKFYLGHWEGDWYLLNNYNTSYVPSDSEIQGMIDWMNNRQNAVDDAKAATVYSDVDVYNYIEVNQVYSAFQDDNIRRVINKVVPYTDVDYVSYSCYDTQNFGESTFLEILDYIESKLRPREEIPGKRVFLGEFGVSANRVSYNGTEHEKANRVIIRNALKWGCPFILYWQMYDNEYQEEYNSYKGFWLINDKNQKQPLYYTYNYFYKNAGNWVSNFRQLNNRLPDASEYAAWAHEYLARRPEGITEIPLGVSEDFQSGKAFYEVRKISQLSDEYSIHFNFDDTEGNVRVTDYHGKTQSIQPVNGNEIQISLKKEGIYFLIIDTNYGRSIKKLVSIL